MVERGARRTPPRTRQRREQIERAEPGRRAGYGREGAGRGNQLPADVRGNADAAIAALRQAIETDDIQAIRQRAAELQQISERIAAASQSPAQGPGAAPGGSDVKDAEVIDAEPVDTNR